MREKVLITGASGFIGYHLVKAAQKAGLEVHVAVRPSSNTSRLKDLNPLILPIDFSDQVALDHLIEHAGYQYIIHAAGATKAKTKAEYNLINATYTLNLANAALKAYIPIKRFVFLSSLAALGPIEYGEVASITENTPPAPVTLYGKSKLLAEQQLAELKDLPLTIIRPTAVYGPGERDLFILFQTLSKGIDTYIGNKPQLLSFVYVKDLVSATIKGMLAPASGHKAYNISDGKAYNRYALADEFKNHFPRKMIRFHLPYPVVSAIAGLLDVIYKFSDRTPVLNKEKLNELTAPNWNCSIEKAQKEILYSPKYDLGNGLFETLKWYKENKWM
jgi:nucleoside-diphosphate-sugar epimerase